jgi:predicted branched-subunit amino acid permease
MFIGIIASGGNPLAAAAAGLLVNARHIPFGVTVRELVGRRAKLYRVPHYERRERGVWLVAAHPAQRKAAYWLCGGRRADLAPRHANRRGRRQTAASAGNHRADAVFPAILLALVIPAFKNRTTLIRAASGAALALAAVPFVPRAAGAAFAVWFTVEEK